MALVGGGGGVFVVTARGIFDAKSASAITSDTAAALIGGNA